MSSIDLSILAVSRLRLKAIAPAAGLPHLLLIMPQLRT